MIRTHFESLYPPNSWFETIKKLLVFAKEGNSSQLIALPGVGRATVLKLLSYNTPLRKHHLKEQNTWFHFVHVDFLEIKEKPLPEVIKFLFLSLINSLKERDLTKEYQKTYSLFKDSLATNDELVLFDGLKHTLDFLCLEKQLTVVFLFDKFEMHIKSLSEDLFSKLAILRSRAKYRFSVVFSLDRPLEDYFDPSFFGNFYPTLAGHKIYLPVTDSPSIEFRIGYIEKATGKTLPPATKNKLLELTGGHANYTRIAVEELCGNSESRIQSSELLEFLLSNKAIRSVSYEIWETLTAEEQKLLISIIHNSSFIIQEVDSKTTSYLYNTGLLKNAKIAIPLFEDFVKFRAQQKTTEKIFLDSKTQAIKKGEFVISDNLTSLEFKLLCFLIASEEIIVSRDEIIQGVWKDTQTTAGVSEEALDQLIFRLRRKIEDDPNNPIHIQTIKGRGFRFTS